MKREKKTTILHICDYAAQYRGNFIDSVDSLQAYHSDIKNVFLFPSRVYQTGAIEWINEMNREGTVAYVQERNLLKNALLFMRILRVHKVDNIIRHFSDLRIDVIIKLLFNSKKVIRMFHCGYNEKKSIKHTIRRFLWKNNKLVGVSDSIAREVKEALPDFDVVSVINAINFERLDKTEHFEKADGISLLMMGWDYERKGVDLAVTAAYRLRDKYDLTLFIIGGENEQPIRDIIRGIVGEEPEWIKLLPSINNVGTYYHASDIFLSPSRREAFGYANVEAAYCKNSIVLSRVDGQGEIDIDGAYWFESDNIEDFVSQLALAIEELHTEQKREQRERVRAIVMQKYSLLLWSNKIAELL